MIAVKNKELESALSSLIQLNGPDYEILYTLDSKNFFEKLDRDHPHLILLDWDFFNSRSADIVRQIKKDHPGMVLICMDILQENNRDALEAEADAFYSKSDPPGELLKLIRKFRCSQL